MAISKEQAMRPALADVIDAVNAMEDLEPYITAATDAWLDEHPEATTTVLPNSISTDKIMNGAVTDAKLAQSGGVLSDIHDEWIVRALPYSLINDEAVQSTTGEIRHITDYSRTSYIDVSGIDSFTISERINSYCVYDSNEVYIRGAAGVSAGEIPLSDGDAYLIVCARTEVMSTIEIANIRRSVISEVYEAIGERAQTQTIFGTRYVSNQIPLQGVYGVRAYPNNLVVPSECVNNHFIVWNHGTEGDDSNYFCTGYIPVTAGKSYRANKGRNLSWYDSNKTFINGVFGDSIQRSVTAPENAAYIRFTINKTTDESTNPFDIYFAELDLYDHSVSIDGLATKTKPWCYGMKINWIGDSIVAGSDFDEYVTSTLGLIETDYGINGSTIALKSDGTNPRNAICLRYVDMTDDTDIIAVSAGTNDFQYSIPDFGTIDSTDNTTFYGALKTLCEGLISKYPQKIIFFTTPIKRAQPFDGETEPTDPFSKNDTNHTLRDYRDAIIEVCGYYSIPVLDLWGESLLNPHIAAQATMFDNALTHPNATGMRIMARRVCGWMVQLGDLVS